MSAPLRFFELPADAIPADDPLPRRRLLGDHAAIRGGGAIGGRIKERPEDFLVEELPLYEPAGEGEHLYLGVQKRDMPHSEMIEVLARHFEVGEPAIGFAGMKDRVAITRQTVSIHLPGREPPARPLEHARLTALWQARHANKLRRGHLAGNRFSIRIRGVDPTKAPAVWTALRELERRGVPDYFGAQRFGYRRNTHRLGRHLVAEAWDDLVGELLGTRSPFPEHQRLQRELVDAGRYGESLPLWGRHDRAERLVLSRLAAGATARKAVLAIAAHTRLFWVNALQSAIFNRVLDRRIDESRLGSVRVGDVAMRHLSGGQFLVTPEIAASEDLEARANAFEISATGPMPGPGMVEAQGATLESEQEACRALGIEPSLLSSSPHRADGTRRPFRVAVRNVELDSGIDEHGQFIRLAFDLPKGAYATVLLREILGDENRADEQ